MLIGYNICEIIMLNRAKTDFKKLREGDINSDYTYFDMHYHTKYSDGRCLIPQIVKKARKLGIGIAVTDHNEIRGAIEISKYSDIPSIPGIEVTSKEGIHTLFYFYTIEELSSFYNHVILPSKTKDYSLDLGINDLLDYANDFNTVIVAPHPYSISWMGVFDNTHKKIISQKLVKNFDAIEVLNGENLHMLNLKAVNVSEKLGKSISGGSDGHTLHEFGTVLTYAKSRVGPKEFLDGIKYGSSFVIGKESNFVSKAISQSGKVMVPVREPKQFIQKSYTYIKRKIIVG
jgi:predicted metal-dependent phosphoesterase TrpH